ncbi:negative transcriptional regulator [Aspergillus heteromorphus CBS 117.55]|uniref:Negative transcriptional regulator n=1 Tax=Aspergillus heteromorphus CBS 117.55 TaxID=1448321 RepID=A0A317WGK2_9EURO|nr:negative transcriptional regulator [Aspergillus heteromorphus CBS 117.55]PWY84791.1 negative transcriptional regulator [Aspergillus heteromorphus CBS 117.55]
MYLKEIYTDSNPETLHAFIRQHPLGVLTTAIPSATHPLLQSTHLPWLLDVDTTTTTTATDNSSSSSAPKPKLRGHIAKSNPQCQAILSSLPPTSPSPPTLPTQILILFTSPHHSYITPRFYTTTAPTTGKVAPTWNYAAVQVYGRATIYDSSCDATSAFLDTQLRDLALHCERTLMNHDGQNGRPEPWTLDDAPEGYIRALKRNIVGIEVEVERMEGKFKMSQERGEGDREGVECRALHINRQDGRAV